MLIQLVSEGRNQCFRIVYATKKPGNLVQKYRSTVPAGEGDLMSYSTVAVVSKVIHYPMPCATVVD